MKLLLPVEQDTCNSFECGDVVFEKGSEQIFISLSNPDRTIVVSIKDFKDLCRFFLPENFK